MNKMLLIIESTELACDYRNVLEQLPAVDSEIQSAVFHLQEYNQQQIQAIFLPFQKSYFLP